MKCPTFLCATLYIIYYIQKNNAIASVTIILYYQKKQLIIYIKNTRDSLVFEVQLHLLC